MGEVEEEVAEEVEVEEEAEDWIGEFFGGEEGRCWLPTNGAAVELEV